MTPPDGPSPPPPLSPLPATPDPVTVPEGVVCIRCGYVLTTLAVSGLCPECGTEVLRSMSEDRIADADPAWLTSITRGLGFLAWGPVVCLIAGTALIALTLLARVNGVVNDPAIASWLTVLRAATMVAVTVGLLAAAVGGVLLTVAEPRDAGRERLDEPRIIARWGLVIAVTMPFVGGAIVQLTGRPVDSIVTDVLSATAIAAGGFGLSALHARLHGLAIRIPSATLATRCEAGAVWFRRCTRIVVVVLALRIVVGLLELYFGALGGLTAVLRVVTGIGGCVLFVILLMGFFKTIVVLDLSMAIRAQIRHAVARAAAPAAHPPPSGEPAP